MYCSVDSDLTRDGGYSLRTCLEMHISAKSEAWKWAKDEEGWSGAVASERGFRIRIGSRASPPVLNLDFTTSDLERHLFRFASFPPSLQQSNLHACKI